MLARPILVFVWIAASFMGVQALAARPQEQQFWIGEILMPNASCPRVTFVVKLARQGGAENWTGSLSIPRGCGITGAFDVPLTNLVVTDERIAFTTPPPPAENTYEAVIVPGEKVATGRVNVGGTQAVTIRMWPVTEEEARQAAPRRPQMPTPPLPYEAREVKVPAPGPGDPEGALSGTLTIPPGGGPFPCIAMLTDNEPHDRDNAEGTHRPFAVLADQLTRAGFAVLRCDDRGLGESSGSVNDSTLDDAATDALAMLRFLGTVDAVDRTRLTLLGFGEGTAVAVKAATTPDSGVASLVLVAPHARPGIEVACARESAQLRALGEDNAYTASRVARLRETLLLAMQDDKEAELDAALRADAQAYVTAVRGMGLAMTNDQIAMWASSRADMMRRPRFRSWLTTDPAPGYRALSCPVLALAGELDLIVPTAYEIDAVRAALNESSSPRAEVKVLPRVNHWMQPCATGFQDEVDLVETTVSETVIAEIVRFLATK